MACLHTSWLMRMVSDNAALTLPASIPTPELVVTYPLSLHPACPNVRHNRSTALS